MSGIIADNSGRHTGLVKAASAGGVWNLIETQTASSSATLDFTSGIDSTYDEYVFKFINIHPETDNANFVFNGSIDAGSNYNVTKTTTLFRAYHTEADDAAGVGYIAAADLAQSTAFQMLTDNIGNDNDAAACGHLHIFNPASTTFVKHFIAQTIQSYQDQLAWQGFVAGYFNDTNDIDAIQFKMSTGDIDAGTISLYGIT